MSRKYIDVRSSWLTTAAPEEQENDVLDEQQPDDIPVNTLPYRRPVSGVTAPDVTDRLPKMTPAQSYPVIVTAAHGGAGASSLAITDPEFFGDCGTAWPDTETEQACVLVAKTSARGLAALQIALQQWAAGETPSVNLLGIVLIADAPGKLPKPLQEMMRVVSGGAPRVWKMPWDATMRLATKENPVPMRGINRLHRHLQKLLNAA